MQNYPLGGTNRTTANLGSLGGAASRRPIEHLHTLSPTAVTRRGAKSVLAVRLTRLIAIVLMGATALVLASGSPAAADVAKVDDQFTLYGGQSFTINVDQQSYFQLRFIMQTDGNLVLYKNNGYGSWQWIWASWTHGNPGARVTMQSDGNLVVYSSSNQMLWTTWTYGQTDAVFVLSPSGEFSIYDGQSNRLWTSNSYQLGYNYPSQAGFTGKYADGTYHTYIDQESNAADRADWQWRIDGPGAENAYEPTDMSIVKASAYSIYIDVSWSQDDSMPFYAITDCAKDLSNNRCDQFRVRFSDELAATHSHMKNNGVCHEWGHTVGFDDGGLAGASCIVGGATSQTSSLERNQINAHY